NHALTTKEGRSCSFVQNKVAVIDELQPVNNFIAVRNRAVLILVIEFPEAGEHAKRDVEFSAGPFADLMRRLQHVAKFGSHRNRMFAGGAIQPLNIAVLPPGAEQPFKTVEFLGDGVESRNSSGFIGGP